jgi:hypothetical protein
MNATILPGAWKAAHHWREAQADLAPALASAASVFGALDERLRGRPEGDRLRLALQEALALSRHIGERVAEDRLILWYCQQGAEKTPGGSAVPRAGWMISRLVDQRFPDDAEGVAEFLGRHDPVAPDWLDALRGGTRLHPIVKSAWGYAMWRDAARLSESPDTRLVEAAVMAARIGAGSGRGGALFLPLATGGGPGRHLNGALTETLAQWIAAVEAGSLAALCLLDRLMTWQAQAEAVLEEMSGRTPARLIAVLTARPVVSAPMAEAESGASRAAVQRNLDRLTAAGLIREITGQGRYRLWTAAF